jgi:hypothetical protein
LARSVSSRIFNFLDADRTKFVAVTAGKVPGEFGRSTNVLRESRYRYPAAVPFVVARLNTLAW